MIAVPGTWDNTSGVVSTFSSDNNIVTRGVVLSDRKGSQHSMLRMQQELSFTAKD